ncbi:hypothetical protein B0H14DRAFT_2567272 [Mycena olivaceomarginata]|nr:hypothetical protein B0H14DRAFT_2593661 [Mycena olivaceomarginata]KAJ7878586.1 hypothetical protein B0H14DRAFT_2567272 [Mycena olivaceomarginata]
MVARAVAFPRAAIVDSGTHTVIPRLHHSSLRSTPSHHLREHSKTQKNEGMIIIFLTLSDKRGGEAGADGRSDGVNIVGDDVDGCTHQLSRSMMYPLLRHPSSPPSGDGTGCWGDLQPSDGTGRLSVCPSTQPSWTGTVTIPRESAASDIGQIRCG